LKHIKFYNLIRPGTQYQPLRHGSILRFRPLLFAFVFVFSSLIPGFSQAQNETTSKVQDSGPLFQLERVPVDGGAELITIRARFDGSGGPDSSSQGVPMVSVLRDTLGDTNNTNDRLRYLWALTYTRPTFWQRMAGAVPFLYTRVGGKQGSTGNPPPIMDLSAADHDVWQKLCWHALQTILLDPYGTPIRASTRSYQRNVSDFRKSHIIRALSILALYQELGHDRIFTGTELQDIQARLLLTDKTFGGLVDDLNLQRFYQQETIKVRDERGHNWELLRQQAEADGLYFEPLEMPDGSATHALVWIAKQDLASPPAQRFDGRFLNIGNPWTDTRLVNWRGYTETRFFDADNYPTAHDTPGARQVEMIPLALYGLDHPKIPALLVDFRDRQNAKRREMSRRALQDLTKNVLAISRFGDLPYFLGRSVFDFVSGKRGMDINQPTRLRTYAQLKLLLSLSNSLEPELRGEISQRVQNVSLNPLDNGPEVESRLASDQYEALLRYAARRDGLPARLARDRRAELGKLNHANAARFVFHLANVLSFGKYTHREKAGEDMTSRLDVSRQLAYHTRFLREVSQTGISTTAASSWASRPRIDIVWSLDDVRRSLKFIGEHGAAADGRAIAATARIFARTADNETRRLCLETLSQIHDVKAREELLHISQSKQFDQGWRDLSSAYLSKSGQSVESVTPATNVVNSGGPNRQ
jgi:hypothetical protein